jgi:DNA invertase Pin-like site-specific DNA recombinase
MHNQLNGVIFHIFGALAEFEREIIKERTNAGLVAAKSPGRVGGRLKALTQKDVHMLQSMAGNPAFTVSGICKRLGIGRTTYFRYAKTGDRGEESS